MKDIKPNYYRRNIKGVEIDVNDIADAFDLGYHAQNAIKYLVRAGRKDEKSLVDDLIKARHYIDRLIKKHEDAERLALYEQIEDRDHAPRSFDRSAVAAIVADYAKDLGPLVQETNPETIEEKSWVIRTKQPTVEGFWLYAYSNMRNTADQKYAKRFTADQAAAEALRYSESGRMWEAIKLDDSAPAAPKEIPPAEMKDMLDEIRKPVVLTTDPPAVATAWPCWVFRRLAVREYNIAGPYPTREAARRALDPGRTDERVVMADDPYRVEADVVERLFA